VAASAQHRIQFAWRCFRYSFRARHCAARRPRSPLVRTMKTAFRNSSPRATPNRFPGSQWRSHGVDEKRFVLLSILASPRNPQMPSAARSSVAPLHTAPLKFKLAEPICTTPVAFLPVDLREASDPESPAHHILFGMVREEGEWKVLSVGLLLLDLPSLEVEWDRAEISSSEQQALESLSAVSRAIENYPA